MRADLFGKCYLIWLLNKSFFRKSGIVRPLYPTVSSNPEDNVDDTNLVAYKPLKRRLNHRVAFEEVKRDFKKLFDWLF